MGAPNFLLLADPVTLSNEIGPTTTTAEAVVAYGDDLLVDRFFNFSATAITAGNCVTQDIATALPTTGRYANMQPGLAVTKSPATAALNTVVGIALDDIPAVSNGVPGRGRVVRRGCIRGTVGFLSEASIARGVAVQTIAVAGTLGTTGAVAGARYVGITLAASTAGGVGHIRLF